MFWIRKWEGVISRYYRTSRLYYRSMDKMYSRHAVRYSCWANITMIWGSKGYSCDAASGVKGRSRSKTDFPSHYPSLITVYKGFNIVSLVVAGTSSPNKGSNKTISLRDNALWFPRNPEDHLQLNKSYFKSTSTATSGFRPQKGVRRSECSVESVSTEPYVHQYRMFHAIDGFVRGLLAPKNKPWTASRSCRQLGSLVTCVRNMLRRCNYL
jgi:hypothetical protein